MYQKEASKIEGINNHVDLGKGFTNFPSYNEVSLYWFLYPAQQYTSQLKFPPLGATFNNGRSSLLMNEVPTLVQVSLLWVEHSFCSQRKFQFAEEVSNSKHTGQDAIPFCSHAGAKLPDQNAESDRLGERNTIHWVNSWSDQDWFFIYTFVY